MMKIHGQRNAKFLNMIQQAAQDKDAIFSALFEACGAGDEVNTDHVFFQEVIIKFNASKAIAVIAGNLPGTTASYFVDVALYAYMTAGFNIKQFSKDLQEYKEQFNLIYKPLAKASPAFASL
jgi:hypothetical protein